MHILYDMMYVVFILKKKFNKLLRAAFFCNNYKYLPEIVVFLNYILVCTIKMYWK